MSIKAEVNWESSSMWTFPSRSRAVQIPCFAAPITTYCISIINLNFFFSNTLSCFIFCTLCTFSGFVFSLYLPLSLSQSFGDFLFVLLLLCSRLVSSSLMRLKKHVTVAVRLRFLQMPPANWVHSQWSKQTLVPFYLSRPVLRNYIRYLLSLQLLQHKTRALIVSLQSCD